MKFRFYSLLIFLSAFVLQTSAECGTRYKDLIFSNVTVTSDITYSTSNGTTLKLDVYEPTGDAEAMRPLIILAHGGSFTAGNKTADNTVLALCDNFAKRGYVCASINYRLGSVFGMLDSAYAVTTVLKAISDGKSAIRFFRKDAATTNAYRIDPNKIIVGGNSAGAVLFMHVACLDSLGEAPSHLQGGIMANGGFDGNSGNDGYASTAMAVLNLAGGMNRAEFVGPGNVACVNFHGDQDDVVPYMCAAAQGGLTPVTLCGLGALQPYFTQYGVPHVSVIFAGDGHTPWASNAAKLTQVDTVSRNFLYDLLCTATGIDDLIADREVRVFPNPTSDLVQVAINNFGSFSKVQLCDPLGRVLEEKSVTSASLHFDVAGYESGLYLLRNLHRDGSVLVKKILVQ